MVSGSGVERENKTKTKELPGVWAIVSLDIKYPKQFTLGFRDHTVKYLVEVIQQEFNNCSFVTSPNKSPRKCTAFFSKINYELFSFKIQLLVREILPYAVALRELVIS